MGKKTGIKKISKSTSTEGGVVEHVQKAPCSLELSRDAKGQARWAVKVYADRDDMNEALDEVISLDARLQKETKTSG